MKFILTLDVGTTSLKTCLFDTSMVLRKIVKTEYELITNSEGFIECFPETYWENVTISVQRILESEKVEAQDILAVSISTQGETLIGLGEDGATIGNAIVWLDDRAKEEAAQLEAAIGRSAYYQATGMTGIWGTTPLSKLLWVKKHKPEQYHNTHQFLLLSDYLARKFTGIAASEETMMSSTGYYHIHEHRVWAEGLLSAGLDPQKIPPIKKSGAIVGTILPKVAHQLGLSAGTVVLTAGNDQICGQVGSGNLFPGTITETTGTALSAISVLEKEQIPKQPVFDVYLHANGRYLVLCYANTAAIILKWFKNTFCMDVQQASFESGRSVYDLLGDMAAEVAPGSEGLMIYPHFEGKNAPNPQPNAMGMISNLNLGMGRKHFVRAIMESVAYMLRENVEYLNDNGICVSSVRSIGGGSDSVLWEQIKSDVLDLNCQTLQLSEATSLGCALTAAVTLGLEQSLEKACAKYVKVKDTFYPNPEHTKLYGEYYTRYQELNDCANRYYQKGDAV